MGDFGFKYVKSSPTKYCGHNPAPRNKFNIQKQINSIANSAVNEIFTQENQNVSAEKE